MVRRLAVLGVVAVLAAGCTAQASRPAAQPSSAQPSSARPSSPQPSSAQPSGASPDPRTAAALLRIATVFNNDYDTGVYGPVWDRWDARSQAVISRADYIRRHTECPNSPQSVQVEDARPAPEPGPGGAWIVDYETGGVQLHDYWFYVAGRWVFDLVLSNPDSVKLYRLTPQQYLAALNCAH